MIRSIEQVKKELSKVPPVETVFNIGDKVTFTNEYGVSFEGLTVIGFGKDTSFYGRFIYLDTSSYWFPHSPEELKHES